MEEKMACGQRERRGFGHPQNGWTDVSMNDTDRLLQCKVTVSAHDVEVFDGDDEVGILLEALNGRRAEHVSGTFDVDAWLVYGHQLDALEVAQAPEQHLHA